MAVNPLVVFCTGMPRSASTWSYNVSRLLAGATGRPCVGGFVGERAQVDQFLETTPITPRHVVILKTHMPGDKALALIAAGTAKNVFTYRDPRDVVCSRMTFEGKDFDTALAGVAGSLKFRDWYRANSATLFVKYEEMMTDAPRQARAIGRYLGIGVDDALIARIASQTSLDASRGVVQGLAAAPEGQTVRIGDRTVDRTTLLQTGHIHRGAVHRWRTELDGPSQHRALETLAKWLVELGYETRDSLTCLLDRAAGVGSAAGGG